MVQNLSKILQAPWANSFQSIKQAKIIQVTRNHVCFYHFRRDFYLPFCGGEKTFPNLCEAICSTDANENLPSKGSCDKCEIKKCNQIFLPVCSLDGERLFANKCHATCAGVEYKDCPGLNMVIPGKTPLPPNKELPLRLQNVDLNVQDSLDENI